MKRWSSLSALFIWTIQEMVAAFWDISSEKSDKGVAAVLIGGHWSSDKERDSGRYHHFWELIYCFPEQFLFVKSVEISLTSQCLHKLGLVKEWISEIRFETNGFHFSFELFI